MAQAERDENFVPTLLAVSSVDGVTPVAVYADPTTHRLLTDSAGGGSGTVTSVSVVSANGFAGSVATATTTPAITLSTTVTGILSGNGTAISAATTTGTGDVVLANSPTFVDDITVGTAATATGSILFKGITSGTVTLKVADAAGTWSMTLPTTDGDSGQYLQTNGSGVTTWAAGSSSAKLPTIVVAASGGDYTDIQSAIDAAAASFTDGCLIYLTDALYTITTGLVFKSSGVEIIGNAGGTKIRCDGSLVATLFSSNADTYQRNALRRLFLEQTNATEQGTAIRAANMSLCIYEDVRILSFGTAINLDGSAANTFYNVFRDIKINECINGISIAGANPVNDNMFENIRISLLAGGAGTGVAISRGQSNNFYNLNVEPAVAAGITGLALTTANAFDNNFYGIYAEANATNVSIGSGVLRTAFFGGQIIGATVANVTDAGTETTFVNVDVGNTVRNTFSPFSAVDTSNAAKIVGYFTNNTSFAHTGSSLVSMELKNGSDTSVLLNLTNAGTGNYITASTHFTVEKSGLVTGAGFVPSSSSVPTNGMYLPAANTLGWSVSSTAEVQLTSTALSPATDGGSSLGTTTLGWQNVFGNTGFVLNIENSDWVATHTAGILTVGTGDLRVTTAGTNTASVVTVGGTQTLTAKTLTSPAVTTGTYSGAQQLAENASIRLDQTLSADGTFSGTTIAGTAGATLAFGDLVYLAVADSRWELTDADSVTTAGAVLTGMCVLAAASDGDATVILLQGNIRADANFPALTVGAPVYASTTPGDIQVAQPSGTDDVIHVVGFALTADSIYFNPSPDYITHV